MKCITFSAIKGGVGKSSLLILLAEIYYNRGYRVLVVDMDIQNSTTFYYAPSEELCEKHNIARAFMDNQLMKHIILFDNQPNLLASSFNLVKLRAIPITTLQRILPQLEEYYDYCLIDAAPTLDNLVLNSVMASDLIITPVKLTQFDWKSALFYQEQITLETGKADRWRMLMNFWKNPRSDNPDTELNQYIQLFQDNFGTHLLRTVIPETVQIQRTIDLKLPLCLSERRKAVCSAMTRLADEIDTELDMRSILRGHKEVTNG